MSIHKIMIAAASAAVAIIFASCGKPVDNGGDKPDPKPDPDPTPETTMVWDYNALYFARMHGPVKSFDTYYDGIHDVKFDAGGRLTDYGMNAYFESAGDYVDIHVIYGYDDGGRLSTIDSDMLSFVFEYGDHGQYIEVGDDIFEYNQLEYLYLFQSPYLKGLTSISATEKSSNRLIKFEIKVASNGNVTISCNGDKWSEAKYGEHFIETRKTVWQDEEYAQNEDGGYIKDENGKYVKVSYSAECNELFDFEQTDGKIKSHTTTTVYEYSDNSSKTTTLYTEYNKDKFNTPAKSGKEVYLYDEWGDWVSISGGEVESSFTYVRDSYGNWTSRREVSIIGETEFTYNDTRKLEYY